MPPRSYEPEILDASGNLYEDVALALSDIGRVNRWLGGSAGVVRPVARLTRRLALESFTLLDVGTGGADIPRALVAWAGRRGVTARVVGLDLDANVVRFAASRGRGLPLLRADGFALPLEALSLDFVTCSLFLHHFDEPDAARLVAEFARVARRAVIVSDLSRSFVPWMAIRLLGSMFAESRMFRSDAPLSVLRGWTADELRGVAERAGLGRGARVVRQAPYRLLLQIDKDALH